MDAAAEDTALASAREAFQRRDWLTALNRFSEAMAAGARLGADDMALFADAAWWLGRLDESLPAYEKAFHLYMEEGRPRQAAVTGFGLAYTRSLRGEEAIASAWASRCLRIMAEQPECEEHGYVAYGEFEGILASGNFEAAANQARMIRQLGHRYGNPNLIALGLLGEGRALVKMGRVSEGMPLLDEAMLTALSDELDPSWAGNIYCHLMLACHELGDLRRAGEWTQATARWCESMPGAGPFMGICRVHRSQVLQARGKLREAEADALRVCEELANFHVSIVGEAYYQVGDLRRQRGEFAAAEDAFREAHARGRDPQPGLALLRLAQGRTADAVAAIGAALATQHDRLLRARLCFAQVEIALAAGHMEAASAACAELEETAAVYESPAHTMLALEARGALSLASGAPAEAVATLREALRRMQDLGALYEAARVRMLLALGYEALGDRDDAALEREVARSAFASLAVPLETGWRLAPASPRDGLTAREREVLLLAAEGKSNAEIAAALVLSVRTVERHLATVYEKLGLSGRAARAAAVSYALGGAHPPLTTQA